MQIELILHAVLNALITAIIGIIILEKTKSLLLTILVSINVFVIGLVHANYIGIFN